MAGASSIEWTEATWNPVTGCNKISPGCKRCYAERMAKRLKAMGNPPLQPRLRPDAPRRPRRFAAPLAPGRGASSSTVCPTSSTGMYLATSFIRFSRPCVPRTGTPSKCLPSGPTASRSLRPRSLGRTTCGWGCQSRSSPTPGASTVCAKSLPASASSPASPCSARCRWISTASHWVIAGGESGPGARPMKMDWARSIRDQCDASGVPYFLKQLGGPIDKRGQRPGPPRRPTLAGDAAGGLGESNPVPTLEPCSSSTRPE